MCDIKFHKPGTMVFALMSAGTAGKMVRMGVVKQVMIRTDEVLYTINGHDFAIYDQNVYLSADEAFAANMK